jgi:tetratricopeptide (TPR) repeat protein
MNDDPVSHLPQPSTQVDRRGEGESELAMLLPLHGWICGPWFDLAMILAPVWLYGVVLLLLSVVPLNPLYWVVISFLTVGHHLPSLMRVYGTHGTGRLSGLLLFGAPVVFLAIAGCCLSVGFAGMYVLLVLWGTWHMMTQLYGVMRIYDVKVGMLAAATVFLDRLMCLSWFVAGLLFSTERLEDFLTALYRAGVPPVPPIAVQMLQLIWGGLTAVVTASYIVNYLMQRRQGAMPSLVKLMVMVSGLGFWWFTMVNARDLLLAFLLFELFHALQSLVLVRVAGMQRVADGRITGPLAVAAFRPGLAGVVVLGVYTLLYGLPAYLAGVSPAGAMDVANAGWFAQWALVWVAASTMVHYCLEGYAWRLRDEGVRADFRVASDASKSVPVPVTAPVPAPAPRGGVGWLVTSGVLVALLFSMSWMQRQERSEEEIYARQQLFLQNVAEAVPRSERAQRELGSFLLAAGRVEEALERLALARDVDPKSLAAALELGRAQRQLQRIPEATRTFQEAVEFAPDSAEAYSELGRTLFGQADLDAGMKMLQRAVELAPTNATYHFDVGLAMAKIGDFDGAVNAFQQAIELRPDYADAYNARGNAYWNVQMLNEAKADFDQALKLAPGMGKAYRNRAGLYQSQQDWDSALADFTKAIGLPDASWRDYLQRGDVYLRKQQYDQARADFLEAGRRDPQRLEPVQRLVTLLAACPEESVRDPEQAIAWAEAACNLVKWQDPGALELLAFSHAAAGNFDQAIHWQEQAIKIVPKETPEEALDALKKRIEDYRTAKSQAEENKATPDNPDSPAPTTEPPKSGGGGAEGSDNAAGGGT